MKQEELNQLMSDSMQDAIDFANEEFSIELDKSLASVKKLDGIILDCIPFLTDDDKRDQHIFTICNMLGAYMGEVFKLHIGGEWSYDSDDNDAPTTFLSFSGKTYAFAGICYQRLVNDQTVSVAKYFELAQKNVTQ